MPELRVTVSQQQMAMLDGLAKQYGYTNQFKRASMVSHLISEAYMRHGFSNRWKDLRAKAALVLGRVKKWAHTPNPNDVKSVLFRDDGVSVGTAWSGTPYLVKEEDWNDS